ncbi:MAG: 3'-5' exonuclease [Spirochaetales bacterium]|nr:3'-5' exonuclease [Spirochaetales bacterium]
MANDVKATQYDFISTASDLEDLSRRWQEEGVSSLAMDFEEESNLHCYGEHVCTIQLFDGKSFYLVDALALAKSEQGLAAMKAFLEGPAEKIMFACQSDASLARKALGIQLNNVFDVRVIAMALEFNGNLTGLLERSLGIQPESASAKKKFQTANWMRRPIPPEQIEYALDDVRYLFELKAALVAEMEKTLPVSKRKQVMYEMKHCAEQKNPERPGWEKICNFKLLNAREKVYIKHFFLARDGLARRADVPASRILAKQTVVAMAKAGTWEGCLEGPALRWRGVFEKARLSAEKEISGKVQ